MGCCDDIITIEKTDANNNNQNLEINKLQEPQNNQNQEMVTKTLSLNRAKTNVEEFDFEAYKNKILQFHNDLRREHKSSEIEEDEELNNMANSCIESLLSNKNGINKLNIYKGQIVGENIIVSDSKNPEVIFNKILNEKKEYNFNLNKFDKNFGHFTQAIWKGTSKIGICFLADKENRKYYTVLLYYPAGNILGEFSENVYK